MKDTIKIEKGSVRMVAHRGVSGLERENTCPAFVAAGNRSYFGVETDVHLTRDGRFVVIHDSTTDRVSNGAYSLNVEESDYETLVQVVLPDLDGSTVRRDIRIPLLSEYIAICQKYEKVCVLEIKGRFPREVLVRLVEQIREMGYLEQMIFISFDYENCIDLRQILPEAEIQWLVGGKEPLDEAAIMARLCEYRLDLDVAYHHLNASFVRRLHEKGMRVNCWTCNTPEEAYALKEMGVDFITTNILE